MPSRNPPGPVERPSLPEPRGPLSTTVIEALRRGRNVLPVHNDADPHGEDLHLALYCCYELHYRGFAGVPDEREWDPTLLATRRVAEQIFERALRTEVPSSDGSVTSVEDAIGELLTQPADAAGVAHHLFHAGERWQLREYLAHRSLCHLKQADPQSLVIARLAGPAKTAFVTLEHGDYGAGDPDRMRSHLFSETLRALDLDPTYGAYVDAVPAETLAEINFMSMCGLHRRLRGALVGQLAMVELTSPLGSDRLVRTMRRLCCPPRAMLFHAAHAESAAAHEHVVRQGVIAPLLTGEPGLAADVVFGIRAGGFLAARLGALILERWQELRPSLRRPLDDAPMTSATPS